MRASEMKIYTNEGNREKKKQQQQHRNENCRSSQQQAKSVKENKIF